MAIPNRVIDGLDSFIIAPKLQSEDGIAARSF